MERIRGKSCNTCGWKLENDMLFCRKEFPVEISDFIGKKYRR